MSTAPVAALVRVGVLVTVTEPLRTELTHWRAVFGDPLDEVGAVPPHITVLAPALVPVRLLPAVVAHLDEVAGRSAPFTVALAGTDTFRPVSPVVYASLAAGARECVQLHRRVRRGPLDVPLQFPFHPHLTIAQGVADPQLDKAQDALADLHAAFEVAALDLYLAEPVTGTGGVPGGVTSEGPGRWVRHRRLALRA